ncbi:NYN domain-containing protein [Devosia sp.]|uniref:NYN domain-containing protein n=1 Tax=Devosia sp. TaxID=1871048 RepID=UPI003A8F2432
MDKLDLAVLIDAENIPAATASVVFEKIESFGNVVLRRAYGDFTNPALTWTPNVLQHHAILPQQQFACTSGKNAADIALVIDAMDLLHSGRFGGFCIVSSDSDFCRLALRLREAGRAVYGIGEAKTPTAYKSACTAFTDIGGPTAPRTAPLAAAPSGAVQLIYGVLADAKTEAGGWVPLAVLGSMLRARVADFRPQSYGSAKLSALLDRMPGIEVEAPGQRCRVKVTERQRA